MGYKIDTVYPLDFTGIEIERILRNANKLKTGFCAKASVTSDGKTLTLYNYLAADTYPAYVAFTIPETKAVDSASTDGEYPTAKAVYTAIQSAIAPELLWTNASPTSTFAAQSVTFDTSKHLFYVVTAAIGTSATASTSQTVVAKNGRIHRIFIPGDTNVNSRTITLTDTGATFGSGKGSTSSGDANAIPLYIYGI